MRHNNAKQWFYAGQRNGGSHYGGVMNQQFELFEIANPCIGLCQSNKKGYCFGCMRSRTERQLWHDMTTEQQREVLRLIAGRKLRIELMRLRKNEQLGFDFEEVVEVGELF